MGHKHSKETRDKIRAARLDRSEESLAKLREHLARLNSSQKQLEHLAKLNSSPPWENLARLTKHALAVVVTNLDTGETVEYKSMAAAAREFGVRTEAVRRCIKSQKPLHNKYQIILKS